MGNEDNNYNRIRIDNSRIFGVTLDIAQDCSLIQNILEGLQGVGGTFNQNKTSQLLNSETLKYKKEKKISKLSNFEFICLIRFPS